ncbi:MAG: hypothetical protein GX591_19695 [Planctomycetes bacterium]|nr:hypothetical protein [Planctomycetota bacterium]
MKRISRLAAAAVFVAAAIGAIVVLSLSHGGATIAWADVQKQLVDLRSLTFNVDMPIPGQGGSSMSMRMMMISDGRMRQEILTPQSAVSIFDLSSGKVLSLTEAQGHRMAMVIDMKGLPQESYNTIEQMNMLAQLERIAAVSASAVEDLGREVVDGQAVRRYHVTSPGDMARQVDLWVDCQTGQPVRMEYDIVGIGTMVMTGFRINEDLDPALFSQEIPEGYEVRTFAMDLSNPSLEDVTAVLRLWVDVAGPVMPDRLDIVNMIQSLSELARQGAVRAPTDEETMRLAESVGRIALLSKNGLTRYVGAGVTFGDASAPVFIYRAKDAELYQVLYGDFHIEEVTEENLPETADPRMQPTPADF